MSIPENNQTEGPFADGGLALIILMGGVFVVGGATIVLLRAVRVAAAIIRKS
jgi:hypothetical protein